MKTLISLLLFCFFLSPSLATTYDIKNEVGLSDAISKYSAGDTFKLVADVEISTNHFFNDFVQFNGNGFRLRQVENALPVDFAFTFIGCSAILVNLAFENFTNGAVSFIDVPEVQNFFILQNCIFSSAQVCKSDLISILGDPEVGNSQFFLNGVVINNVRTSASLVSVKGALKSISVVNSEFVNNESINTDNESWLFNMDSRVGKVEVNQVNFSKNLGVSLQGGGFKLGQNGVVSFHEFDLRDCLFEYNVFKGPALFIGLDIEIGSDMKGDALIENSYFKENVNSDPIGLGGAVAISKSFSYRLSVDRCTFYKNKAAGGGAIVFVGGDRNMEFRNSTFYKNESGDLGGAVVNFNGFAEVFEMIFNHCSIVDNITSASNQNLFVKGQGGKFSGSYNIFSSPNIFSQSENFDIADNNYVGQSIGLEPTGFDGALAVPVLIPSPNSPVVDFFSEEMSEDFLYDSDQIGFDRVSSGSMDAGAIEYQATKRLTLEEDDSFNYNYDKCEGDSVYYRIKANFLPSPNNRYRLSYLYPGSSSLTILDTLTTSYDVLVKVLLPDTGTLVFTASSSDFSLESNKDTLDVYGAPDFNVPSNIALDCNGQDTTVNVEIVGAYDSEDYFVDWYKNEKFLKAGDTVSLNQGNYEVHVTSSQYYSCFNSKNLVISEPDLFFVSVDSVAVETCIGNADGGVFFKAVGGTKPYQFSLWNDQDSLAQIDSAFLGLEQGDYFWTAKDDNGCETSQQPFLNPVGQGSIIGVDFVPDQTSSTLKNASLNESNPIVNVAFDFEETMQPDLGGDIETCLSDFSVPLFNELPEGQQILWLINSAGGVQTNRLDNQVDVSLFDQGERLEIIAETINEKDFDRICPRVFDTVVIKYRRDNLPSASADNLTDLCITDDETVFNLSYSSLGNSSLIDVGWEITYGATIDTIWSATLDVNSFPFNNSSEQFLVSAIVSFDDECLVDDDVSYVKSATQSMKLFTLPMIDFNMNNFFSLVAGNQMVVSPFALESQDQFYNFTLNLNDLANQGGGQFLSSLDQLIYTSDPFNVQDASVVVQVSEAKCGWTSEEVEVRFEIINSSPIVSDFSLTVVQGRSVELDLNDYITDEEDNVITDSLSLLPGSVATGAITLSGKSDLELNYQGKPEFIGQDVLSFKVCDPEYCVEFKITIDVVEDFDVSDTLLLIRQGTQGVVNISDLTTSDDYSISIEGPFTPTLKQIAKQFDDFILVDTVQKLINIDFTLVADFVGTDSVVYRICEGGTCKSEVIRIRTESHLEFDELEDVSVKVYNVLSPNGDGKHEYLKYIIYDQNGAPQGSTDSELLIFNRGGDLVYKNQNYDWTDENNRFEGFYRDTDDLLPAGTYFYTIILDEKYGKVESKGFLVIKY